MPESKKSSARPPARSRAKKKLAPAAPRLDLSPIPEPGAAATGAGSAPGSVESLLLMVLGVLFVVGALFPRSLRQLLMLGLGGGMLYRGITTTR